MKGHAMLATKTKRLPLINGIPLTPIFGAEQGGTLSSGDLVTHLADGTDINALWGDMRLSLSIYNEAMDNLIELLTFPVTNPVESVAQVGKIKFERATEIGIPNKAQLPIDTFQMGYGLEFYDKAVGYTWRFLADADRRQIDAIHNEIMDADKRQIFHDVMAAIFDNRMTEAKITGNAYNVYPLYNGVDGVAPPKFKNTTFTLSHSHYLVSGNSVVDSSDLEDLYQTVAEHGYSAQAGTQFLLLANKAETDQIRKFRAGAVNNNSITATYDFIPATGQPTIILPNAQGLLGDQPGDFFRGMPIIGKYGFLHICEEDYIPIGYMLLVATGGKFDLGNPVGLRQHANPAMQGLRILGGNQQSYPLIDGFYSHGFGTGIRQRGGAAIMQIKASGTYDIPVDYTKGGLAS